MTLLKEMDFIAQTQWQAKLRHNFQLILLL